MSSHPSSADLLDAELLAQPDTHPGDLLVDLGDASTGDHEGVLTVSQWTDPDVDTGLDQALPKATCLPGEDFRFTPVQAGRRETGEVGVQQADPGVGVGDAGAAEPALPEQLQERLCSAACPSSALATMSSLLISRSHQGIRRGSHPAAPCPGRAG